MSVNKKNNFACHDLAQRTKFNLLSFNLLFKEIENYQKSIFEGNRKRKGK